jgi:heat shock protein HslJ
LIAAAMPLLTVAGCGGGFSAGGEPGDVLDGTEWTLTEAGALTIPEGAALTIRFDDGQVSGSAACNNFTGSYTVDGTSLTINSGGLTRKACPRPLLAAEAAYIAALGEVASFNMAGEQLTLLGPGGAELLVYRAVGPSDLLGEWEATSILIRDRNAFTTLVEGTTITAVYAEDGTLSGSGGCNQYNASYQATGTAITITQPLATLMACLEPAGVMEQEGAYLLELPLAASFSVVGDTLTLRDGDGIALVSYRRAGSG